MKKPTKKELYFIDVPENYKNFVIKNYDNSGSWLMEIESNSLNHWNVALPKCYTYTIVGFVKDFFLIRHKTEKNFILERIKK